MVIAIDVGYSSTKAISSTGDKVVFTSVVAPAVDDVLSGAFKGLDYVLEISNKKYFIGEAALRSSGATTTLERNKPPEIHDLLVLTAAYLLGADEESILLVGLPISYFKTQKANLKTHLEALNKWVSINGGPVKRISFTRVEVYPQALGAICMNPTIGYSGVVDIGYFTTDFILVENDTRIVPILEGCQSAELGINLIHKRIAGDFHKKTGTILPQNMYEKTMKQILGGQSIDFKTNKINLTHEAEIACRDTARQIQQTVLGSWTNYTDFLSAVVCVGGGSELLRPYLSFQNMNIPANPVFANAEGYLYIYSQASQAGN